MDLFDVKMCRGELGAMSSLALAHVGDAVYELLARAHLARAGGGTAAHMHRDAVKLVAAPAQARMAEMILPELTEEESAVFRRGRNAKVSAIPHAATPGEYHEATALEALFGYLFLSGRRERVSELFDKMMEGNHVS